MNASPFAALPLLSGAFHLRAFPLRIVSFLFFSSPLLCESTLILAHPWLFQTLHCLCLATRFCSRLFRGYSARHLAKLLLSTSTLVCAIPLLFLAYLSRCETWPVCSIPLHVLTKLFRCGSGQILAFAFLNHATPSPFLALRINAELIHRNPFLFLAYPSLYPKAPL